MSHRSSRRRVLLAALAAAALAGGCAYSLSPQKCPYLALPSPPSSGSVEIRYLGTGGFLVRRGEDTVLFGPVYTNPTALEVFLDHEIRTDNRLVERLLPPEADAAQAIVVGHSHYDHLMDTPYVALHRATHADVYGSHTTQRLLWKTEQALSLRVPPNRVVAMDEKAAAREWQPLAGGRMRLLAIPSEHSDQFRVDVAGLKWAFHTWRGDIDEARKELPRSASEWAEGPTFAYLLDFLDAGGHPIFRVYYQDSGTHAPVGFVPLNPQGTGPWDGKAVDVALVCGGGDFERLRRHPEGIIANTRPRHVIVGHWEDFFVTQRAICTEDGIRGLPVSDTRAFVKRARAAHEAATGRRARVYLPCPTRSVFQIPIDPGAEPEAQEGAYDCSSIP